MIELWQLYNEQGQPMEGQGAAKEDVYGKALLHGASHIWVWRVYKGRKQILLQKRAASKKTWPNRYDASAAGHIDIGEDPLTAAIRETQEEIGIQIEREDLYLAGLDRRRITSPDKTWTENEFCWLYIVQLASETSFELAEDEVASLEWHDITTIKAELESNDRREQYVPHGDVYYATIFEAIESAHTE